MQARSLEQLGHTWDGLVEEIGAPNVQVQFDLYHCQITEGDVAVIMRRDIAGIAHMQVAGVPDRHEPDSGRSASMVTRKRSGATGLKQSIQGYFITVIKRLL